VVRAEASGSERDDRQIPGRVARVTPGKERSAVFDFVDMFEPRVWHKAKGRHQAYAACGWDQHGWPAGKRSQA